MPQTQEVLTRVLRQSQEALAEGKVVKAYFDLDSTLFDVTPRVQRILELFCTDSAMQLKHPKPIATLKTLKLENHPYYIKDLMHQIGLINEDPTFYKEIFEFWKERFFHDDLMAFDRPEKGAVEFVNHLLDMGAEILYLTGRDVPRMYRGTLLSLKKAGFPVEVENTELILKPHQHMDDALFKMEKFAALDNNYKVWFFENEPVNIHLVLEKCPHVDVIYFHSIHSGKAEEPFHLPTIRHFEFR